MDILRASYLFLALCGVCVALRGYSDRVRTSRRNGRRRNEGPRNTSSYGYRFDAFNSFEKTENFLKQFAKKHKDIANLDIFGQTYEGRPLYLFEISSEIGERSKKKPLLMIECLMHAREWTTLTTCVCFIRRFAEGYTRFRQSRGKGAGLRKNDRVVGEILDRYDVMVMPITNPDGYVYSRQKGGREWRKNRSCPHEGKCHGLCVGVDVNRNFDDYGAMIGNLGPLMLSSLGDLQEQCTEVYAGPRTFSELESSALRALLLKEQRRLFSYFSIHADAQMLLLPYASEDRKAQNYKELERVAKVGVRAIYEYSKKVYPVGIPARVINYTAPGASYEYAFLNGALYSFALELRTGIPRFSARPEDLPEICTEAWIGVTRTVLAITSTEVGERD